MELEIGVSEIERDMLDKDDNELLEQLTSLLLGPVRNLGTFQSEENISIIDDTIAETETEIEIETEIETETETEI